MATEKPTKTPAEKADAAEAQRVADEQLVRNASLDTIRAAGIRNGMPLEQQARLIRSVQGD